MTSIPDSRPKTLPMADIAYATDPSVGWEDQDALDEWFHGIPHVVQWAWQTGPAVIPMAQRFTLVNIARYAEEDGWASPGMARLSRESGCSRQTVSAHVHFLERLGLLEIETEITDAGIRNRYRLTGVYWDWKPVPQDYDQPRTVEAAYATVITGLRAAKDAQREEIDALRKELARRDDTVRRMGQESGGEVAVDDAALWDVGERDGGLSRDLTENVVVEVVSDNPSNTIEDINTTTTTTKGVGNLLDNPPESSNFRRVSEFVYRDEVWQMIGRSSDNPRGWADRRKAVNWYLANFDEAPPGKMSFLEQEHLYSREAELETQAEEERRQREQEEDERLKAEALVEADPRAKEVWEAVLGKLQSQFPKPMYETWLRRTCGVSMDAEAFVVGVPTSFAAEHMERRMYHAIETAVREETGNALEIRFIVANLWQEDEG